MKTVSLILLSVCMLFVVTGCGKTVAQLREDGGSIVDNGGSLIKKAMDAAVAIYDLGKKFVDDGKDNVNAVKDAVLTPAAPAK